MTNRKYKMCYDYKKRTSGGFIDALFLGAVIVTGSVWLLLALIGR